MCRSRERSRWHVRSTVRHDCLRDFRFGRSVVLSFCLTSIKHSAVRIRLEHEIAHVIEASDERFWLPNLGMPDRYCIGPVWAGVEIRCLGIEVALARQLGLPSDYEPADIPISQYVPWLASIHHGTDTPLIRRRLMELYEKSVLFPDPVGEFRRKLRLLP